MSKQRGTCKCSVVSVNSSPSGIYAKLKNKDSRSVDITLLNL